MTKRYTLGFNNKIVCEPMHDMATKTVLEGAGTVKVARLDNKISLVELKVLTDYHTGRWGLSPGDSVFVRGASYTSQWAKEIFTLPDLPEFILVPEVAVEIVSRLPPQECVPLAVPRPSSGA